MDVFLPEYKPADYKEEYEELVNNTTVNKVAALAEIGYLPDMNMLKRSRVPRAYFMLWSKEFCIGEKYNIVEKLKEVYLSDYSVVSG